MFKTQKNLNGFLHVSAVISCNVTMRPDVTTQRVLDNHSWALGAHPSHEEHDPRTSVGIDGLKVDKRSHLLRTRLRLFIIIIFSNIQLRSFDTRSCNFHFH